MVVTRDFELQYIETKEVPKIRGIDMDCGITTACFVKIHGISDVKEMEYCKGRVFFWDKRNKIKGNMRKRSYLRINVLDYNFFFLNNIVLDYSYKFPWCFLAFLILCFCVEFAIILNKVLGHD